MGLWSRLFGRSKREGSAEPSADDEESGPMKLIVGLGNLEPRYVGTRHNIGFMAVDALAAEHGATFTGSKHQAHTCTVHPQSGPKLVLAKPTTLMNRSGHAVRKLVDFYRVDPESDLLVICDDFSLDLGHLRLRPKGSHGGQNGLRHIIEMLGSDQWARLRCGIGPVPPSTSPSSFVLDKFRSGEKKEVEDMVERTVMCVLTYASEGLEAAQARYNGKAG